MKYSIIFISEKNIAEFYEYYKLIKAIFEQIDDPFEILIISNGSRDPFPQEIGSDEIPSDKLKIIVFQRPVAHSICVKAALSESKGEQILILSAFQELTQESYVKLIHSMTDGVDMVVPNRKPRKDALLNKIHSKALNIAARYVMGIKLHDIGCNVKIFRKEIFEVLDIYGNMFKYFAGLAAQKGYKVKEIECVQSDKTRAITYYDWKIYLNRGVEILNLFFSTRYSKKPLRFFNFFGAVFMCIGFSALVYVGFAKFFYDVPIGERKSLIIGLICLIGGIQIASFGLLGEIVAFVFGRFKKSYSIEKII